MVTKVYFIRHAEAMGNMCGVYQGRIDTGVTDNGKMQLEALAERFKTIPFDAIYSSPTSRARLTAEAADRTLKLPIVTDDRLMELDGGKWEGLAWDEIAEKYPDTLELWNKRLDLFEAPDGEKVVDVQKRIVDAVNDIVTKNAGKTVVITSHGCALRTYFCYAARFPLERINDDHWAMNTSVSLIEYDEKLAPRIVFKGDVSHLDDAGIYVKRFK